MSLICAVEGETDVPVARKIVLLAGWEQAPRPIVGRGKDPLDRDLRAFNSAAKGSPWFVLRDLDHDAPCPGLLVSRLLPRREPLMCLRVAVRAIESWLMADSETLATFLHVPGSKIPSNPEGEDDPKRTMVDLARRSTKPAIQRAMLPPRGVSRRTGPGYEASIIAYAEGHWRADVARGRSPSLHRAVDALERLRDAWCTVFPVLSR